jgi:hypothetical protein
VLTRRPLLAKASQKGTTPADPARSAGMHTSVSVGARLVFRRHFSRCQYRLVGKRRYNAMQTEEPGTSRTGEIRLLRCILLVEPFPLDLIGGSIPQCRVEPDLIIP